MLFSGWGGLVETGKAEAGMSTAIQPAVNRVELDLGVVQGEWRKIQMDPADQFLPVTRPRCETEDWRR